MYSDTSDTAEVWVPHLVSEPPPQPELLVVGFTAIVLVTCVALVFATIARR